MIAGQPVSEFEEAGRTYDEADCATLVKHRFPNSTGAYLNKFDGHPIPCWAYFGKNLRIEKVSGRPYGYPRACLFVLTTNYP